MKQFPYSFALSPLKIPYNKSTWWNHLIEELLQDEKKTTSDTIWFTNSKESYFSGWKSHLHFKYNFCCNYD